MAKELDYEIELKKVYLYCEKQQNSIKDSETFKFGKSQYVRIHLEGQVKAFGLVKQKINNLLKKRKNNG